MGPLRTTTYLQLRERLVGRRLYHLLPTSSLVQSSEGPTKETHVHTGMILLINNSGFDSTPSYSSFLATSTTHSPTSSPVPLQAGTPTLLTRLSKYPNLSSWIHPRRTTLVGS